MLGFSFFFLGADLLLIVLAIPLVLRRVRPNLIYGLRIPATLRDDWVWYEANAASGRDLLRLGLAHAAATLALPLTGMSATTYVVSNATLLFVAALAVTVVGMVRANRLGARGRPDESLAG